MKNFYLVGGTNLSLRYGHQISDDIDIFSKVEFEKDKVIEVLERNFKTISYKNNTNLIFKKAVRDYLA